MFLVDDDQPKVLKRQEQRRTGADDHLRAPRRHHPPEPAPLGLGDARMPFPGPCAEPRLDAREKFRGQRDFRQQHQRLPPAPQTVGHGFQIDLGLARAGDALQKRHAKAVPPQRRRRRRLIFGQNLAGPGEIELRQRQIAGLLGLLDRAELHQPLHHLRRDACQLRELAQVKPRAAVIAEHGQNLFARLGQLARRRRAQPIDPPRAGRIEQARRARGQPQHRGQRGHRVRPHADQEVLQFRPHWRHIQNARNRAQLARLEPPVARAPDDADDPARPERHFDESARETAAFGCEIVQRLADRLGGEHRDAGAFGKEARLRHGQPRAPQRLRRAYFGQEKTDGLFRGRNTRGGRGRQAEGGGKPPLAPESALAIAGCLR